MAETPNRSAGRIEDELWLPFLARCREEGISNTDGFRVAIRLLLATPSAALPGESGARGGAG